MSEYFATSCTMTFTGLMPATSYILLEESEYLALLRRQPVATPRPIFPTVPRNQEIDASRSAYSWLVRAHDHIISDKTIPLAERMESCNLIWRLACLIR